MHLGIAQASVATVKLSMRLLLPKTERWKFANELEVHWVKSNLRNRV